LSDDWHAAAGKAPLRRPPAGGLVGCFLHRAWVRGCAAGRGWPATARHRV